MKYVRKTCLFLSMAAFVVLTAYYTCRRTEQIIFEKIEKTFDAAILFDLEYRSREIKLFFSHHYYEGSSTASFQFIEHREGEQIVHEKGTAYQTLSDTEKATMAKQTYLLTKNPVRVSVLDSIFRVELAKQGIVTQSAVSFFSNMTGETVLHENREGETDIFRDIAVWAMVKRTAGLEREITLRGFVRITPAMILKESLWPLILLLTGVLIVLGLPVDFMIRRKKRMSPPESVSAAIPAITPAIEPAADSAADPPPPDPFQLDIINRVLICQGCKIVLTDDMFRLFKHIWEKKDHYALYEDIFHFMYGNVEFEAGKRRITQTVRQLRSRLKSQDVIKIENVSRKGYRILLK
jgi:hypothetical protein